MGAFKETVGVTIAHPFQRLVEKLFVLVFQNEGGHVDQRGHAVCVDWEQVYLKSPALALDKVKLVRQTSRCRVT